MSHSRRQFLTYTALGAMMPMDAWAAEVSELQKQLNWLIKRQRREGRISSNERTAWSVYDFQTKQKLVSLNEDYPMQAASMIKIYVALAYLYLHQRAPYKYPYGQTQQAVMEKMLVRSSNDATNMVMRWCKGPANVARLAQQASGWRFKQLRIVEYIPAGGRTYRNRASAHDYNRFYYDLWADKLPQSAELKRILSIKNHDRMTSKLMPDGVTVYDKTGSTGMLCGDAGIVELPAGAAYTFIGIVQRSSKTRNYGNWVTVRSAAIREASTLVYRFMSSRYRLLDEL